MNAAQTPVIYDQLSWGFNEWLAVAGALGSQVGLLMTMCRDYPDDRPFEHERRELRGLETVSRRITNDAYERLAVALAVDAAHAADMAEHEAQKVATFLGAQLE
jgi:hypothetical protein